LIRRGYDRYRWLDGTIRIWNAVSAGIAVLKSASEPLSRQFYSVVFDALGGRLLTAVNGALKSGI
jgi:hypothetical protein